MMMILIAPPMAALPNEETHQELPHAGKAPICDVSTVDAVVADTGMPSITISTRRHACPVYRPLARFAVYLRI